MGFSMKRMAILPVRHSRKGPILEEERRTWKTSSWPCAGAEPWGKALQGEPSGLSDMTQLGGWAE